jgi:RimJ/RimL family protein N-acetyltransferase
MTAPARKLLPPRIDTERLYLRPYQAGDGKLLYEVGQRNQKHLARFEAENVLLHLHDEVQSEAVIQQLAADWQVGSRFFLGIFEKTSSVWVGQIYVGPVRWDVPVFGIGYVADVGQQGKGYITEAVRGVLYVLFKEMNAHRVQADCHEANEKSWRLLERCGFQREGHLRENKFNPDGTFHGDYLYGLIQEEFMGSVQDGVTSPEGGG